MFLTQKLSFLRFLLDTFVTKEVVALLLLLGCFHSSEVKFKRNNYTLIFRINGNAPELTPNTFQPKFEN